MVFKAKKCEICGWNTVYATYIRENCGTTRTQVKVGYFCQKCGNFIIDYKDSFYNPVIIGIPTKTEEKNISILERD